MHAPTHLTPCAPVLALLALFSLSVARPASAANDGLTVTIGSASPLSGAQSHLGRDTANGVRLAVDELNARGVLIGGKKARFVVAAEDDGADPRQGTAVAQKFCDDKVNGVVGHMNSGTAIPAAKIYSDCDLPNLTPSATNPKLTQSGYKTSFRMMANDNELGAGLAALAADKLRFTRVAVIDDRTAYGQGVAEVFRKTALAKGIQIVAQEYTTDKATDFSAILTTIRGKAPDAIFYGGTDSQAGPMVRQLAQLGMDKVRLFGGDGICTSKLAELSGGARTLANVVCAESGTAAELSPKVIEWKKRYEAKYPGEFQIYSPYAYDATMVLAAAMVKAGSADPAVYARELFNTSLDGITARIAFDATGELKNPAMTLYRFEAGKKVALK
ncbi:branched-chain amino acid ABC transporter substrate-binding protein [Variovorax sp. J22G73]|uniref:branched-chain amino acid ABC transporter substrate-binding protein n=1 Tax=unclassified Variovorax TaxID=663243 RepID=UPI002577AB08|nr:MULTISPECIES: branched-chain amino acid ABC transporter substrate-binding protein [unclassified Variovorax]MDM0005850.1 branched-chain amino acid ABC transporter substrate-binding protein [Variovorax sp. J22R203]MDM0099877.1 branched-chain amino acid ABC transporter substrate-binding protein [Variovorax sp. J22G73]